MELLQRGARDLGLELSNEQLSLFQTYLHELQEWNQRFNLTAITEEAEVQAKHFLDSITPLLVMAPRTAAGGLDVASVKARAIDVGAGAGFPGVPLKIVCPGLRLTLLESTRKKAGFLEHLVRTLGLDGVSVEATRAEDLARQPFHRDKYDFALARALAPLPVLLEYCLPFVRPGGLLIALKKGDLKAEIDAARPAVRALGGKWRESVPVQSPLLADERVLIVVEKAAGTPKAYPRRAGIAAKQPIGSHHG